MAACLVLATLTILALPGGASVQGASTAPAGLTAVSLDDRIVVAWDAVGGATGYRVYRGSSPESVSTLVGSPGGSTTTFTDSSVDAGDTAYYAVRAVDGGGQSPLSNVSGAKSVSAACGSSQPIVRENCMPGTRNWTGGFIVPVEDDGIEGFATATSIEAGQSVNFKADVGAGAAPPVRIEVYRNGWYDGEQGRLMTTIPGLTGTDQPACHNNAETGMTDCSNWSTSATLTTTTAWPTGVYMVKFVREDNGFENEVPLVVRDDGADPDLLYKLPVSTYQAYNFYGGKSLYDSFSEGANTISGGKRAVEVSFDRPYVQSRSALDWYSDWYGRTDLPLLSWLERQGYDVGYVTDTDVQAHPARLRDAKAVVNGIHDEYWTGEMREAAEDARDAGVSLVFPGANGVYWKTRLETSATTGVANRVLVCYKTTAGGPVDPSGSHTGTWRDPAGANRPENALQGVQYIGDSGFAPIKVSAAEGRDRFWRHTEVASLAPGTSRNVGSRLIGWEWDQRFDNGFSPAGLDTLASSPVSGNLLTDAGRVYTSGPAVSNVTRYRAPSGAFVWSSGTNNWSTGLARNETGNGEPNSIIQQATLNLLTDMQVQPATPAAGMVTEPPGPPSVTGSTPASAAVGVSTKASPTVTFDRSVDPFTLRDEFTLTGPGGQAVEATVTWDENSLTGKIDPAGQLDALTLYTARVGTGVKSWSGETLGAVRTWSFTTGLGEPPEVASTTPADGATNVPIDTTVRVRFDRQVDPTTLTAASFSLRNASGTAIPGSIDYDAATRTATLTPTAPLAGTTQYTARVTTAVRGDDNTPLTAQVTWSFTTGTTLDVVRRVPDPLGPYAGAASPDTAVRAEFSRLVDASTLDTTSFQLRDSGGNPVPATVSYNAATRVGSLMPNGPLANAATYTARLSGVRAADGSPLGGTVTWQFTTALTPPPAPAVSSRTPLGGATDVDTRSTVRVTFDRAIEPDSLDDRSFVVKDPAGTAVAAGVTYNAGTRTATLTPSAPLGLDRLHTAELTTAVRGADGARLATPVVWSFRTASCPCTLWSSEAQPTNTGLDVRDGRSGAGPFSYELGTKITVSSPMELVALRYWRDPGETGSHTGRVWTSSGTQIASTTFRREGASGWQRQALDEPVTLDPGETYVVSVGMNARFAFTPQGLANPLVNGPLSSVTSSVNGVFGASAGSFPTNSWNASSYFVDAVVRDPTGTPMTPHVSQFSPSNGAAGIGPRENVRATFDVRMDASTIDDESVYLTAPDGSRFPGSVAYDAGTRTVTLDPVGSLELSTTYTARLTNAIRSDDGSRLADGVSASFTTAATAPPEVDARTPDGGATAVPVDAAVRVRFDRPLDPATLDDETFTLRTAAGAAVPAALTYEAATRTAVLTPSASLAATSTYRAEVTTGVRAADGTAKSATESWTFQTGVPIAVTRRTPGPLVTAASPETAVRAELSKALDPATLTASTFSLEDAGGPAVAAALSYNPATRLVSLIPTAALSPGATYTARLAGIRALDDQSLSAPVVWTFTTALSAPPAPAAVSFSPTPGAAEVSGSASLRVRFDRALDPDSVDAQTVQLRNASGTPIAGALSYDAATSTVRLKPAASLALHSTYDVAISTSLRSADGSRLASALNWSFTTGGCPCSIWGDQDAPASTGLPTVDGRPGGFHDYELGTKLRVTEPTELVALRYWRDASETGAHVGRVWNGSGTQIASATFTGETASGWQRQRLAGPVTLQPGTTYTVSVGVNTRYGMTRSGLAGQLSTGPLIADGGANGVFNDEAGNFPSQSWSSSAYFVDAVVRLPGEPRHVPQVVSTTPLDAASGVAFDTTAIEAAFNVPLDPGTVTAQSFTLRAAGASSDTAATVSYDADTGTARLRPNASLRANTTYTARLSTAIRSDDDTPMPSAYTWTFVTAGAAAPAVAATTPADGGTGAGVAGAITARFDQDLDPATVTGGTFTLTGPSGAVAAAASYDAATRSAVLTPTSPLAGGATYTARLTTEIESAAGVPLAAQVTWSFTTQACPCSFFSPSTAPATEHLDVADGRGAGDWSYELGLKFRVTAPTTLNAIRFHKDPDEAGTHVGRLWTADGNLVAQTTFSGETGSGWQQQSFSSPVSLAPGQTYVASVSFNDYFGMTADALAEPIARGPLVSVADGNNGVFAPAAGTFPTGSWRSSSYLIDVVVG